MEFLDYVMARKSVGNSAGGSSGGSKDVYAGAFKGINLYNTMSVFCSPVACCIDEVYAGTYNNIGTMVIE